MKNEKCLEIVRELLLEMDCPILTNYSIDMC